MTEREDQETTALERAAAALPREIHPDRDLWPAIEARIEEERPDSVKAPAPWLGRLAAAIALVAAGSLSTYMLLDRRPAEVAETAGVGVADDAAGSVAELLSGPAPFGTRHALGEEYLSARAELASSLADRLATLPPDTRVLVLANLIEIREALDAINAALAEDPDNILLQRLLLTAYQDEMYVLADLNSSTDPLRERIDL